MSSARAEAERIVATWPNYANPVDAIEAELQARDERAAKIARTHNDNHSDDYHNCGLAIAQEIEGNG